MAGAVGGGALYSRPSRLLYTHRVHSHILSHREQIRGQADCRLPLPRRTLTTYGRAIHDVLNHAGPIEQDLRNCTVRCGDARRAMSNPERLLIVIVSAGMLLD
ncbi:hypothetical protein J6590_012131 [Homalodisca vitripennis]|nr:hypothetical protein J6590_012131 [Homalodisca vitripennis]